MTTPVAEQATGSKVGPLLLGALGAVAIAVFVAPLVTRFLGIAGAWALLIAGVVIALIGYKMKKDGFLHNAGQTLSLVAVFGLVMSYAGPMLSGMNFLGAKDTKAPNRASSVSGQRNLWTVS